MSAARTRVVAVVVGMGAMAWASVAGAIPIFSATLVAKPNPASVLAGNPGAINWTLTNTSTSTTGTDNLNLGIFTPRFSARRSLVFLDGDANNQAFNAQIVNAGQYSGLVLGPQGTVVFTEIFQSQDLSPIPTADVGRWTTNVVVGLSTPTGDALNQNALGSATIAVVGTPEPASVAAVVALAGVLLLRRRRVA